jgi:hypothetical protein
MSSKTTFAMSGVTQGSNWTVEIRFDVPLGSIGVIDADTNNTNTYNFTTNPSVYVNNNLIFQIDRRTTFSSFNVNDVNIVNEIVKRRCSRHTGSGVGYISWRTADAAQNTGTNLDTPLIFGQYPLTGYSFDIYQVETPVGNSLNDHATSGFDQFTTPKSYTLHPNKFSLIYNYDQSYPVVFSKGGTLTITSVET